MVSITCLEFSYTQAPKRMKSFIMAFFMMSIAAGNLFTSAVNFFIANEDGSSRLEGAAYFEFFTLAMLLTAVVYVFLARIYRGDTYLHDEIPEAAPGSESLESAGLRNLSRGLNQASPAVPAMSRRD